ncbi:hypothetical protein ACVWYI_003222 [Bradyrhizobium sp. LB13.1]
MKNWPPSPWKARPNHAACERKASRPGRTTNVDESEVEMLKDQSPDRAKREANKAFKPTTTQKPVNDYAKDQNSFNENRERLKAERLAREAKPGKDSD